MLKQLPCKTDLSVSSHVPGQLIYQPRHLLVAHKATLFFKTLFETLVGFSLGLNLINPSHLSQQPVMQLLVLTTCHFREG